MILSSICITRSLRFEEELWKACIPSCLHLLRKPNFEPNPHPLVSYHLHIPKTLRCGFRRIPHPALLLRLAFLDASSEASQHACEFVEHLILYLLKTLIASNSQASKTTPETVWNQIRVQTLSNPSSNENWSSRIRSKKKILCAVQASWHWPHKLLKGLQHLEPNWKDQFVSFQEKTWLTEPNVEQGHKNESNSVHICRYACS